jgi:hypothetical protein
MTNSLDATPSTIDRTRHDLVGLKNDPDHSLDVFFSPSLFDDPGLAFPWSHRSGSRDTFSRNSSLQRGC